MAMYDQAEHASSSLPLLPAVHEPPSYSRGSCYYNSPQVDDFVLQTIKNFILFHSKKLFI